MFLINKLRPRVCRRNFGLQRLLASLQRQACQDSLSFQNVCTFVCEHVEFRALSCNRAFNPTDNATPLAVEIENYDGRDGVACSDATCTFIQIVSTVEK